jgi:hypothetical protein
MLTGFLVAALLLASTSPAWAQAFPATSPLDNFNTNGALPGTWLITLNTPIVSGNAFVSNSAAQYAAADWNTTFTADQEVYATIGTLPAGGLDMGFNLRSNDVGLVLVSLSGTPPNDYAQIYAGGSQIGLDCPVGVELTVGQQWGLRVIGATITLYLNGAVLSACTRTDPSPTTGSSRIGLYVSNSPNAWDAFGGGSVVAAAGACPGGLTLRGVGC